jgi:DNA-binding transcriptional ArsR family regulator
MVPADQLSRVFSALADPTRRHMVARLTMADATVNELAKPYDVSVQAVSKHLRCSRRPAWSADGARPSAGPSTSRWRCSTS